MSFVRRPLGEKALWFFNDCLRCYWRRTSDWLFAPEDRLVSLGHLSIHWGKP